MKKIVAYLLLFFISYLANGRDKCLVNDLHLTPTLSIAKTNLAADPSIYAYSSGSICVDDSVLLGVTNLPSDAIGYNWQKDGVAIAGANRIPYPARLAGVYTLAINLANGSVFITNTVTVAIAAQSVAPVILAQGNTTFCNGQSVVLSSSDPGNLQWQKDAINIKDANFQTYTATVGGNYRLKYSPLTGCPGYSNEISINVTNVIGPVITESVHSVPVCIGTSFRITSSASSVQWQKDAVNITGATNQFLEVTDNGKYRTMQINTGGGCPAFSNEITITSFLPIQSTPTIVANSATSFCNGSNVVLSSSVTLVSGAAIQWRLNGVDIIGATNQTYTATQAGNYTAYVVGNGRYCNNTGTPSNVIFVTVNTASTAPVITAAGNLTFCQGSTVTLTSNTETGIQWQKDGVDIAGANSLNYAANQSGIYRAIVRGDGGCDGISNAYTITVLSPSVTPTVTLSGSTNICSGSTATLSASVANVQWQKDGVDIDGAVFQSYLASQTGTYRAYITGSLSCGANYSNGVLITVSGTVITPVISAASTLTFCSGGSGQLLSNVANIQWQLNGANISGAIATMYAAKQTGSYTAVATNGFCTATSNALLVTVVAPNIAPVITAAGATTVCNGSTITLTSTIANVQWQKDGVDISGATFQAYTAVLAGVYRSYQPAALACGITYSNIIAIVVNVAPTAAVISANGPTSFCSGTNVTLASSIYPVQWRLNGLDIGAVTSSPLVVGTSGTYTAATINGTCTTPSNPITVTVSTPGATPIITAITSADICTGGVVILSSGISGVQWQKDGVDIAGAIFQAYNANQSGVYRTYVPGAVACGINYSNLIAVTVSIPPTAPTITANGAINLCSGGSVIITSNITPVLWQKDGANISGTTPATLTVATSGTYRAYVTTGSCSAFSSTIVVTVNTAVAPIISAAGSSTVICGTGGLILTSTATVVQWQLNGANILGATAQTYAAIAPGNYTAVTTGSCNVTSNNIILTVGTATATPIITAGSATNLCSAGSVILSASLAPVQWTKDNVDISGAINQTLNVTNAGSYKAYSTNGTCTAYSSAIVVTVSGSAPVIAAANGGSLTICNGTSVILNSTLATVQWQLNGATIIGATSQTYTAITAGVYTAVGTGNTCSSSSNSLTILVSAAPTAPIVSATGALFFCNGDSITLAANISGVQWLKDSVVISGANGQTYNVTQAGKYRAAIINIGGCSAFSNELIVTINFPANAPTITTSGGLNFCAGTTVTLSSSIAGVTWQKDFTIVATNTQTYVAAQSGNYRAVVFGGTCPAYSNVLAVTVNPSPGTPTIVSSGATTFCDGSSTALVSNFANVQWLKDGVAISGATSQTYTATVSGVYKALATNGTCTTYSNEIIVIANIAASIPTITANGSLNTCSGTPLTLTSNKVNVTWQKDFVTIATGVQTISVTESGSYRAVVFGSGCPGYSNILAIVVSPSTGTPLITATGATTFCDGSNVILVSTLANIQWLKDGVAVAGATGQTYTASKAGSYRAFISNGTCTNYSNEVAVAVNFPAITPTITANSSLNICDGSTVTLTSNVAGVIWQKDFTTVAVNTQSFAASQAGSYRAIFFSNLCSGYSNPVVVGVTVSPTAPTITALGATTFCDSGFVTLASNVAGVQWLQNGSTVPNAFSQTYTAIKAGVYRAVVYGNNGCNGLSNPITVTVTAAAVTPTIVNTSASTSFCAGTTVNLVSSTIGITWQKDGTTYANPNTNNQVLPIVESGMYRAVYFSSTCPGYSNAITLTLLPQPLTPVAYRITQNLCDTGDVIIASTLNTGSMQWQKDSVNILGATTSTYSAKQSGNYRLIISLPNVCPSYSNNLPLVINTALKPVIIWDGNQFKTFTNYSTYQWYLNNVAIVGANLNTYKPMVPGNYKIVATSTVTCVLTSDVYQLLVTAVTTPTFINGATVKQYPNPATNDAWIEFSQVPTKPVTVRLLNATGAVLQTVVTRQRKINLSAANNANGLYFIEVIGADDKIVYKLIINK